MEELETKKAKPVHKVEVICVVCDKMVIRLKITPPYLLSKKSYMAKRPVHNRDLIRIRTREGITKGTTQIPTRTTLIPVITRVSHGEMILYLNNHFHHRRNPISQIKGHLMHISLPIGDL